MTNAMRRSLFKRHYHDYLQQQHRTARRHKIFQRITNDPESREAEKMMASKQLWDAQSALIKAKYQFIRIGNVKGFRNNLFLRLRRDSKLLKSHI